MNQQISSSPINLLDYDRASLAKLMLEIGEPAYRSDQLIKWIHQLGVTNFDEMTNLSKKFRAWLHDHAEIVMPSLHSEQLSSDGTRKWLLQLHDGNAIETVFIPEPTRGTLCISSQVGCGLNCDFCATARQGFNRNLSVAEIISQLWFAVQRLSSDSDKRSRVVTNIVLMGMGEPLLNFDAVVSAMNLMMDDLAYNLSKYRVTLSTSGLIPAMEKLREASDCALAVSLHASNDEVRTRLVPVNKKYPIKALLQTCRNYFKAGSKRAIVFEYVMLDGVNDHAEHAKELVRKLRGINCKINLIPFNPFTGSGYRCSSDAAIAGFQQILRAGGYKALIRRTRGEDIDAACGQLVGDFSDRTTRKARWAGRQTIPITVEEREQ